jgi:hypothetical protein
MGRTRFTGRESLLANNALNNGTSSHLPDPLHWDLHEFGHCGWQVGRGNTLGHGLRECDCVSGQDPCQSGPVPWQGFH